MKLPFQIILFLLTFALTTHFISAAEPALAEPVIPKEGIIVPTFGNATNITLLARLLHDADPRVRERVARELGETHNPAALKYLEEAISDKNTAVRCAVISACTEFPETSAAKKIVINALGDTDPVLLQTALRSVARMNLKNAAARIRELLLSENPHIRFAALEVLNFFGKPAENGFLPKLLADPSVPICLEATRNALLCPKSSEIIQALKKLTETTSLPAVQAGAIEALGKLAMNSSEKIVAQAAKNDNPLLRRAAVRSYANAGKIESVEPFLKDPSAMVRLSAIQAAGDLKSRQIKTLYSLMFLAPEMQSHLAARKALLQIGSPDVAGLAAEAMKDNMEKYLKQARQNKTIRKTKKITPFMVRHENNFNRNVVSCCFILGELRSKQGFDYMLSLGNMVEINSPIMGGMARALGKIDDNRAVAPLTKILKKCEIRGFEYLTALTQMAPPPPYSGKITSDIIETLGELEAYSTIDIITNIVSTKVMGMRLPKPAGGAARTFIKLIQPDNREKIEKSILEILGDKAFGLTTRSYAIKTAAKLKIKSAVPILEKILNDQRPTLLVMQTAAWAIQELTGQTPPIPQPKTRPGAWIIQQLRK